MPDPHLRKAMAEIQKLLRRYRIGGAITLVSKTHAEYAYQFPYWSVIQPERGPGGEEGIRIRSFKTYYRSKEEQREAMAASLHCLLQMRDIGGQTFVVMDDLRKQVEEHLGTIEHVPFSGFESTHEGDAP
jgi:hypothetical protein